MFIQHLNDETLARLIEQLPPNENETDKIISEIAAYASRSVRATMSLIAKLYDSEYMSKNTELNVARLLDYIGAEIAELGKSRVEMTSETHKAIDKASRDNAWTRL